VITALKKTLSRLPGDTSGSIAIMAGLISVILIVAIGFALDFTNASRVRTNIQASLDAGLLSAATNTREFNAKDEEALKQAILGRLNAFMAASGLPSEITDTLAITVTLDGDGIEASAKAVVQTAIMRVVGIDTMDVSTHAAVLASSVEPMEIALALDVTDSMSANMPDLRTAAQRFVDKVTGSGSNAAVTVGLVPFVGAVNIGNQAAHLNWMDQDGKSKYHAVNLRGIYIARRNVPECPPLDDDEEIHGGSDSDSGWLDGTPWKAMLDRLAGVFQIGQAQAATPYVLEFLAPCDWVNPKNINHFTLFDLLPGVSWKGCVEARPEPLDVSDAPPSASNPDTLWVPYFWPDGPDLDSSPDPEVSNTYLDDSPYQAGTDLEKQRWGRAYSAAKYMPGKAMTIDESPPYMKGPNRACPDPILPLTSDYGLISSRISSLEHYEGSGTNTAEGVAWAWRLLSPGAPFTEGKAYGTIRKVMVLMSDGENRIVREVISPFGTHYSSYGSVRYGRFPHPTDVDEANAFLDSRMELACRNAKNEKIEIFVIALGITKAHSRDLLEACATDPEHMFEVGRSQSLDPAFDAIAAKLSKLRLAK
jgi:Flp pilus assembly protein TadG